MQTNYVLNIKNQSTEVFVWEIEKYYIKNVPPEIVPSSKRACY